MLQVITARDHFDYGYRAGKSHAGLCRRLIRDSLGALTGDAYGRAARHRKVLADRYPAQLDVLEGLSRAVGEERDDVLLGSLAFASHFKAACTNFAAVPPATLDDQVYASWNFDLSPAFRLLMGKTPLYVRDIKGCKPYLCLGFAPLFSIGIMNGDGLVSCVNSVGAMDGGEGLTFFELNNLAMENHSTVDGAVSVWKDNPREVVPGLAVAIILNSNNIFADVQGDAAVLECSHNYVAVQKAAERNGILASANHHQFLDRALSGGADPNIEPAITGSYARLDRMYELLDRCQGRINPHVAKAINSDHGLNYTGLARDWGISRAWYEEKIDDATICCHPFNFFRHLKRFQINDAFVEMQTANTLYSMLMEPKRCTIWFISGKPCRNQYTPIWLGDVLRMEWAGAVKGDLEYDPDTRNPLAPQPSLRRETTKRGPLRRPQPAGHSESVRALAISTISKLEKVMAKSLVEH